MNINIKPRKRRAVLNLVPLKFYSPHSECIISSSCHNDSCETSFQTSMLAVASIGNCVQTSHRRDQTDSLMRIVISILKISHLLKEFTIYRLLTLSIRNCFFSEFTLLLADNEVVSNVFLHFRPAKQ